MASRPATPNTQVFFSILLALLLCTSSSQTYARDSQLFFSKVTKPNENINTNKIDGVTTDPNLNQPQDGPMEEYVDDDDDHHSGLFTAQTTNSGYGLFSHESAATQDIIDNDRDQYYSFSTGNVPENGERRYSSHHNKHMRSRHHVVGHETRKEIGHSTATGLGCKNRGKNYAPELRGPIGGHGSDVIHIGKGKMRSQFGHNGDQGRGQHGTSEEARFVEFGQNSEESNAEKPRSDEYVNNYNHYYHDDGRSENGERGMRTDQMKKYQPYSHNMNYFNRDDGEKGVNTMGKYENFNRDNYRSDNNGDIFFDRFYQNDNHNDNMEEGPDQRMYVNGQAAGGGSDSFDP